MAHVRKQLRNAGEAALPTAFPGYTLRKGAVFSVSVDKLPECGIVAPITDRTRDDVDTADHEIELVVVARAVHDKDAFDQLDDLSVVAVPILQAAFLGIGDEMTVVDLVREEQLATTLGSDAIAVHQLTFRCVASTLVDDPETLA